MQVILYKRHKTSCPYKADKTYRRCRCSVWLEWNVNGKQNRKSAKTISWDKAQQQARAIEQAYFDAELGRGPAPMESKSVEQAISLFLDNKSGEDLADNTLYKHRLTCKRLQEFCDLNGIYFAKDINLAHLTTWRATWRFNSPLAKRSYQERVKTIFKYWFDSGVVPSNVAARLSSIQVKADEANQVSAFEPEEYEKILAAIANTSLRPRNQKRVRACMQLQRWSGLSLVDAVCHSRAELEESDGVFRVRTQRRKTGVHINNVIPAWRKRAAGDSE